MNEIEIVSDVKFKKFKLMCIGFRYVLSYRAFTMYCYPKYRRNKINDYIQPVLSPELSLVGWGGGSLGLRDISGEQVSGDGRLKHRIKNWDT